MAEAGPETKKTNEYANFITEHDGILKGYSGSYLQFLTSLDTKDFVVTGALSCHAADIVFKDSSLNMLIPETRSAGGMQAIQYGSLADLRMGEEEQPQFRPAMGYFDAGRYVQNLPHAGYGRANNPSKNNYERVQLSTTERQQRRYRGKRSRR